MSCGGRWARIRISSASPFGLNGSPFTVIGVAPAGFYGLHIDGGPDLYVPLAPNPALGFASDRFEARAARWIAQLVGRLDDGVTVEQTRAEMSTISDRMATADPAARGPRTITVGAHSGAYSTVG